MRAVMLAAGVGRRLGPQLNHEPKLLLSLGGKTLLRRHLEILDHVGIGELVLVTGYRAGAIEAELAALESPVAVTTVHNPDYTEGSVVSLWCAREALRLGGPVVLMDGDVLYDRRLMARLLAAPGANCFAMDGKFEPGDADDVAWLRDCLQSDVDRFLRPVRDYDLVRSQRATCLEGAASDLNPKIMKAREGVVRLAGFGMLADNLRKDTIELRGRQEVGVRRGDTERNQVWTIGLFADSKNELADLELLCRATTDGLRWARCGPRLRAHEVSGLRASLDESEVFQTSIRLEDSGDADRHLSAELAHGRYAIAFR